MASWQGKVPGANASFARWHKPVFLLFLLWLAGFVVVVVFQIPLAESIEWTEGTLYLVGAASTLVALTRRLPVQNVFAAAALILGLVSLIIGFAARTGIPFGSVRFTEHLGYRWFGLVPWPLPFLWLTIVLASRGIARLIMRPYRRVTYYGFWVIGISVGLAVIFDLGFQPFASQARHYWIWETPARALTWYSAPWVNSLGCALTAFVLLAVSTPWLLNKQPVKQPTDFHGLAVWAAFQAWFSIANAAQGRWPAAALSLGAGAIATLLAVRGARW